MCMALIIAEVLCARLQDLLVSVVSAWGTYLFPYRRHLLLISFWNDGIKPRASYARAQKIHYCATRSPLVCMLQQQVQSFANALTAQRNMSRKGPNQKIAIYCRTVDRAQVERTNLEEATTCVIVNVALWCFCAQLFED